MAGPLQAVIGVAGVALMAQAVPVPVQVDSLSALLSLAGKVTADLILVGALWWLVGELKTTRSDAKAERVAERAEFKTLVASKDDQITRIDAEKTALAARVIETMVSVLEAVKEFRGAQAEVCERMEILGQGQLAMIAKLEQIHPISAKEVVDQLRRPVQQ